MLLTPPGYFATLFEDQPDLTEFNIRDEVFGGLGIPPNDILVLIRWIYDEDESFDAQPIRMLKFFVIAYQRLKLPRGFLILVERGM